MQVKSILIVDDSLPDRMFLKYDLDKTSYAGEIFESIDGEEAINFLKNFDHNKTKYDDKFPPALIFLDINMPKINGFEFLDILSKMQEENNAYNSVVIVMISSSAMEDDIEKSLSYKCVQKYLVKGAYEIDDLRALLL